jgi:hypothetical protein
MSVTHTCFKPGGIRELARPHGLTIEQFAEEVGIGASTAWKANRGQPIAAAVVRSIRLWLIEQREDPNLLRGLVVEPGPPTAIG